MTPYQGEYDPRYHFNLDHLAAMEPNAVELLLEQGRVSLAEFVAAGAMREAKQAPCGSQLLDEEVARLRMRSEKYLPLDPSTKVKGNYADEVIREAEALGLLRASHRGGK